MNSRSIDMVRRLVESSGCRVDLQWQKRIFKKHSSEAGLLREASRCFGSHGDVYSKELVSWMKQQRIINDFVQN